MATRKISDLTLLDAGNVSSSDTLLLLDNSDPTDQNKRTAVGSIFRAIPGGNGTTPGLGFELKTSTGLFSTSQGQIGLALGDSKLNLQKVGTSLVIGAQDTADTNLDLTISAQGSGLIRLGSVLAINDSLFVVPNSSDNTKVAKFSSAQIPTGTTRTYILPESGANDTLVSLTATQTLTNKTLVGAVFTGTVPFVNITVSGNTTLGDDAGDIITVNGASTFSAAATFSNTVQMNQTLTVTGETTLNNHVNIGDNDVLKIGDGADLSLKHDTTQSFVTNITGGLYVESDELNIRSVTGSEKYIYATVDNGVELYFDNEKKFETTTEGVTVTGSVGNNNLTVEGDALVDGNLVANGTTHTLQGSLGVGRQPATYALEVEGSIYSTGESLIWGSASAGRLVIQKGAAGIDLEFRDDQGVVQAVINGGGQFGLGKTPTAFFDVAGDGNFDGDLTLVTTDPQTGDGGTLNARQIILTDPITGQVNTLNATSGGGVSRAKTFFHAYS